MQDRCPAASRAPVAALAAGVVHTNVAPRAELDSLHGRARAGRKGVE